ncbi:YIP1 family protein [Paenibacillus sp. MBLB4367]|uniref:YIP1 family protein n=1 Tax=Paenibacillus sp. MBLB4367 TaxID=3384767 RepID=UPI003907F0C8
MRRLGDQLAYSWKFLWHPIDGFYDLRFSGKGSVASASVLLALYYGCQLLKLQFTHFVFNPFGLAFTSPFQQLLVSLLPVLIWVLANYLVSCITKGQGTFKAVYISTAYSMVPFIYFSVPVALVSNVFSNAEGAIYGFMNVLISAWIAVLFYIQVKEVHGFEVMETFTNIGWMLFAGVAIIAFAVALFGIVIQSVNFAVSFLREAIGYV